MRRLMLSFAAVAALAVPATASAQAGEEPRIPPGAKAGGQDVGNLTLTEAAAKLDSVFAAKFARNLEVRIAGKRFTVHTKDVGFAFDALKSARRANIAAQKAPKAPDGSVDVEAPLATSLDAANLAATVATIDARSTKPARDATVKITLHHLRVRQG